QTLRGPQPGLKVERRYVALETRECESRQRVQGEKLIALAVAQRPAESRVEEIFLRQGDVQKLVGLRRRAVSPFAFDEEAVRDAVSDLIRIGDQIPLVNRQRAIEVVNAGDAAIFDEGFDDVFEPRRSVLALVDFGQRGRA